MNALKLLLIFMGLISSLPIALCIVTLRPKNERGPSAANSGVECLESVHSLLQHLKVALQDSEEEGNATVVQTNKNVIMLHLHNLTSPAAEIESNYLKQLNQLISSGQMQGQLRVVTDNHPIDKLLNVAFNHISEAEFYILVTDDFDKLIEGMRNTITRASSWNPTAKFIILFNNVGQRKAEGKFVVDKIFQEIAIKFHVNHILLLFAKSASKYDIYVSRLFRRSEVDSKCIPMSAEKITECEHGKIPKIEEFSQMLQKAAVPRDLSHCTFTVCAAVAQPFVRKSCRSGLEIQLIKFIASYLNFNLSVFCTTMPRGEIRENGELTNLLLKMRQDQCDFIMGSMYPDNEIHTHFKTSHPYYEDSYTWFVPLAPLRAPWKGLVYIFNVYTWLLILSLLLFTSIVWYCLGIASKGERRKFKRFSVSMSNNFSTQLGISVPLQPLKTPLRILFMGIILYSLNMTTIYTSNLISVFTQPAYDAQLESIEEVLERNMRIGGREEYHDWFDTGYAIDDRISARYNFSEEFQPSSENLDRVRRGEQVILLSRLYVLSRNISDMVHGLPDNVFSNQMEIIFEKGFPLVTLFNKILNRVKDNGIIYKFFNDWQYQMTRENLLKDTSPPEIILTVHHLDAAFAVLIYGLLLSTFVFICELIFYNKFQMKEWRKKLFRGYYLIVKYPTLK